MKDTTRISVERRHQNLEFFGSNLRRVSSEKKNERLKRKLARTKHWRLLLTVAPCLFFIPHKEYLSYQKYSKMKMWPSHLCFRSSHHSFYKKYRLTSFLTNAILVSALWENSITDQVEGVRAAGHSSAFLHPLFEQEKPIFTSSHSVLTPLWTTSESVATTYHAKLFMTDDTYRHLLVWHPVFLFWWQDWRNIQLLTTLNRGLLCPQAPSGRRRSSWPLGFLLFFHSEQSRVKRNLSSWKGLNFPL